MRDFLIPPLSLSNFLTVLIALSCTWTIAPQSKGRIIKLWRLAVPSSLAAALAVILLVEVIHPSVVRDAEWIGAAVLGCAIGQIRGRPLVVQSDHVSGLLRPQPALDGLLTAAGLLVFAILDFISAALECPVFPPEHVAAGAALGAGFICWRSLALAVSAALAPHVELRRR